MMNRKHTHLASAAEAEGHATSPLDFRRPDRIAKSQLRAIHQLHENFVRSLASSLSAYLRTHLLVNLVSVEQLSYLEFLECLPAPTCIASVGLKPFDGNAVIEINSSLVFPILEILLGGDGKMLFNSQRETTEIEQVLVEGLLRHILRDLRGAWKAVAPVEFAVEKLERSPNQLKVLSPAEAVVAVAIEMKIGDNSGMLNLAVPSINIKMMGQKFDHQWTSRKTGAADQDQRRTLNLIRRARLTSDVRLNGAELMLRDLADLQIGDVLNLQAPRHTLLDLVINGQSRYRGQVMSAGRRAAFRVTEPITDPAHRLRRAW